LAIAAAVTAAAAAASSSIYFSELFLKPKFSSNQHLIGITSNVITI
jgi:hypothetical protein